MRRDRHELTIADVPALQKAGLTLEANELLERARKVEINKLEEDYKAFLARKDIPREHQQQYDQRDREARIASKNFYGGRI